MNKSELIAAMAADSGLSKADTEKALNAFLGQVEKALKAGDKVQLTGFRKFRGQGAGRADGRNPQTGAEVKIPASKAPVFKAGKSLKDAVQ